MDPKNATLSDHPCIKLKKTGPYPGKLESTKQKITRGGRAEMSRVMGPQIYLNLAAEERDLHFTLVSSCLKQCTKTEISGKCFPCFVLKEKVHFVG